MRNSSKILVLALAASALIAPAFAQTRLSTTSAPVSQPATSPAAPRFQGVLAPGTNTEIREPPITRICAKFAAAGGPYLMLNSVIFRLTDGKEVGRLPERLDVQDLPQSLSPDGSFLALYPGGTKKQILIIDTTKGRIVHEFAVRAAIPNEIRALNFTSNNSLVLITSTLITSQRTTFISIWDPATAEMGKEIVVPQHTENADVSYDGKTAALAGDKEILLFDLTKKAVSGRIPTGTAAGLGKIRLSPDATELAATVNTNIVVWDLKGRKLFEASCAPMVVQPRTEVALQFLPDGTGILVNGRYLLDRRIGKITWQIKPYDHAQPSVMIMNDSQIFTFEGRLNHTVMKTVDIPRAALDKAVNALAHPAPDAALKPKDAVRLDIQVKNVRFGTPDDLKKMLSETLTRRLAANDLSVSAKADIVLQVNYDEAAAPNATNVVQGNKVVGTTSQTVIRCDLKMLAKDQKTVLFERSFDFQPAGFGIVASAKPEDLRSGLVGVLNVELSRVDVPLLVQGDLRIPVLTVMPIQR